jgi:peptidoglycan/LPS O-acetylase OafA/YrhL
MFSNHLYSFPDRFIHGNYYIPLIPSLDLEFYIGNFGSVCVSMFIFLSGYGMFLGYVRSRSNSWRYSIGKIVNFYLTYWLYFLIFVPIGLIFFKNETLWNSTEIRYTTDLFTLLTGFLGWSARYNSEWWFVRMFVSILLCLSPTYLMLGKRNPALLGAIAMILFSIAWALYIDYTSLFGFIFWQISFAVGILCARLKFFSSNFIEYFAGAKIIWLYSVAIVFWILRFRLGAKIDFLFMPVFVYLLVRAIEWCRFVKIFSTIGKYSFPIWLIHSFFCYYYFQDFIYAPRWSPLVFLLLAIVSLLVAIFIETIGLHIQIKFSRYMDKKFKNSN